MAATRSLLLALLGAPILWVLHLGVSYFLVSLGCGIGWNGAKPAVVAATIVCAVAAMGTGLFAWKQRKSARGGRGGPELDPGPVPEFLAISGALLAVLFTGAIIMAGVSPFFLPLCSPS
ncbi:MAG TPA: hypothetical protein VFH26_06105 [Gemmatimonadales bacterium]|nr:hypothetical protein [Gemmatimonadales bacterium]